METIDKHQKVLAFFDKHEWLLDDPRFAAEARRQIASHSALLAQAQRKAARARAALRAQKVAARRKAEKRRLQSLAALPPQAAICKVFGAHCGEALRVSRCESGFSTNAQNGQYLGLFQMGSSERRIFGHGSTPLDQAKAAYRYFVRSGRDWSPWSCKPW